MAVSRRLSTLSATPRDSRNCSYRRPPSRACRRISSDQGSPSTSSARAIGQLSDDQSDRSGTVPPGDRSHSRWGALGWAHSLGRIGLGTLAGAHSVGGRGGHTCLSEAYSITVPSDQSPPARTGPQTHPPEAPMTARDLRPAAQGAIGAGGRPAGTTQSRRRLHPAWIVAGVAFVALLGAAGFRAAPSVLIVPMQDEYGWSRSLLSLAVGVNLLLYGMMAPFAAALMDRFGVRAVTSTALVLVALGSGLTVFVTAGWQLVLCWGVLVGLGTGSMALVFAATIANRWFVRRRGLVMGVLTAASATGQLIFLPMLAWLADNSGWRAASLLVSVAALAVVPLVLCFLRNDPADVGVLPYGAPEPGPATAGMRDGSVPAGRVLYAVTQKDSEPTPSPGHSARGDDGEIADSTVVTASGMS